MIPVYLRLWHGLKIRVFFCSEDPDCLPDGARRYIAENEAEGIYTVGEMFKRTEELSDP